MISEETIKILIKSAKEASKFANCHISNFKVGAALLTEDSEENSKVYYGCNVESDTHTLCVHAEINALTTAICEGERNFKAIAVYCMGNKYFFPCLLCRQMLYEKCGENLTVIACCDSEEYEIKMLSDLVPYPFKSRDQWTGEKIFK